MDLTYHRQCVRDLRRLTDLGVNLSVEGGRVRARMVKLDETPTAEARELVRRVTRHVLELMS